MNIQELEHWVNWWGQRKADAERDLTREHLKSGWEDKLARISNYERWITEATAWIEHMSREDA